MKKLIILFDLVLFFNLFINSLAYSQQKKPIISFETLSHDFGTFKEETGPVKYQFKFTNKGNAPLLITDVKASCGCTTPDWTKSPVQPGQTGFVSASFDPSKRPGNFDKTVTVTSNADQVTLRITGEVIAKVKTTEDIYPVVFDNIRIESGSLGFAKVLNTGVKTDTLRVLNTSGENVKLSFENIPVYIKIKTVPENIKPKDKGLIIVTYFANNAKFWGFRNDNVNLLINNKKNPSNVIAISANIEEDFSKLTKAQLADAPLIRFEKKEINFGSIKEGEIKNIEFKFTNAGKSDLMIRDIKAASACKVKSSDEIVKPGKSGLITVTFNSAGRQDKQIKIVTVLSNDPKNSEVLLKITGTVEKAQK